MAWGVLRRRRVASVLQLAMILFEKILNHQLKVV
jgi:hypothetical protein